MSPMCNCRGGPDCCMRRPYYDRTYPNPDVSRTKRCFECGKMIAYDGMALHMVIPRGEEHRYFCSCHSYTRLDKQVEQERRRKICWSEVY